MPDSTDPASPRKRGSKLLACCAVGCAMPLTLVFCFVLLYIFNNRPPELTIPSTPMPPQNAYDDFLKAAKMIEAIKHKSPDSMPGPPQQTRTFANFKACSEDATPGLALLRQSFSKPYQNPPVRSFMDDRFPVMAQFREVARTISGDATYWEMAGQPGRAADSRLDGMEMGVMIPRGGLLIEGLVGVAVEAISLSRFEPLLPKLSQEELAHVAERQDRIAAKRAPYADFIIEEGRHSTAGLQELLRKGEITPGNVRDVVTDPTENSGGNAAPSGGSTGANANSPDGSESFSPPTPPQMLDMFRFTFGNKTAMLKDNLAYYESVAAEMRKPFTNKPNIPPTDNPMTRMGISTLYDARPKFVAMEAVTQLLQTEVALFRYKAAKGRFPDQLSQLVPGYLKAVPDDPFGGGPGKPFLYRPLNQGKGFLLYSVGPNMRDDGGQPTPWPGKQPGDIVAGQMWPKRRGAGR